MKELTLIQNELHAPKNQFNSFGKYKYRNCEDILEALKPLLKKHKVTLNLSDRVIEVNDLIIIETTATIVNEKGTEVISTAQAGVNINRKGMDIAQSFGASSSYSRKYCLSGLFLIDDSVEIDSLPAPEKETKKPKFTKTHADAEFLKGTSYKELDSKYEITPEQIAKFKHLTEKKS